MCNRLGNIDVTFTTGTASDLSLSSTPDGAVLAVWSELPNDLDEPALSSTPVSGIPPGHAPHPQQIRAAIVGSSTESIPVGGAGAWTARASVCAIPPRSFFIVWEEYEPEGCTIRGAWIRMARIDADLSIEQFTVFPSDESRRSPHKRYLNPTCIYTEGSVLIAAVEITDVISETGVRDQSNRIVSAMIDISEDVESARPTKQNIIYVGSPALLNHGLLADVVDPTGVWGYLGPRRRPMLLPGGTLVWERKLVHDGFTPDVEATGVLCCSVFDFDKLQWGEELVLHRGSYSYEIASVRDGYRLLHRPVDPEKTHGLVLEKQSEAPESAIELLSPENGYRKIEVGKRDSSNPRQTTENSDSTKTPRRTRNGYADSAGRYQLYWGDPHVHSVYSKDPEGEVDELLYYAKEVAGLDFVAITDNDEHYSSWLRTWERNRGFAVERAWHHEGSFVVLDGFELTYNLPGKSPVKNHRTVLLPSPSGELVRWSDDDSDRPGAVERLVEFGETTGALSIAHHQTWRISDSESLTGTEACSGWDAYFHDAEHITSLWDSGRTVCLIGGSDNHRRNPGHGGALTGVWSKGLEYSAIIEGLASGRTIATQGRRPIIDFTLVDEEGTKLFIGDKGRLGKKIRINLRVDVEPESGDTIELVELMHRRRTVMNWSREDTEADGKKLDVSCELTGADSMKDQSGLYLRPPKYLYVRLRMNGKDIRFPSNVANARGPWAWTTPIWWE